MADDLDETPVFAVVDIGATLDVDGNRWPTAVIDPEGHPEIADLARVHAVEGVGDIRTEAAAMPVPPEQATDDATHLFLLAVRINTPVRCTFGVSFVLPAHMQVLTEAAAVGQLVIATTDPDELPGASDPRRPTGASDWPDASESLAGPSDQPLWLALDVDADLLTSALADLP